MKPLLAFCCSLLLASCAAPRDLSVKEFKDYLLANQAGGLSYNDIETRLGTPAVRKSHDRDLTASWIRTYRIERDESIHGEKIIVEFEPESGKMLDWRYKQW